MGKIKRTKRVTAVPKMTLEGFLRRFRAKVKGSEIKWITDTSGYLRTPGLEEYCPIEFLAGAFGAWIEGRKLGLTTPLICLIVDAADNQLSSEAGSRFSRKSSKTIGKVRQQLLRAAGMVK